MLPLHHRTICINFLSISSSPSCVTPNHRVPRGERSKCVVSRYRSKVGFEPPSAPCGSCCPTRIRTLTDRTKTCSASHYTMGQILLLPTDTSVIVCECKGRKKKPNHQTFRRKNFPSPPRSPVTTKQTNGYRDSRIVLQENPLGHSVDDCDAQIVLCRIA